jgi:hypothetical protein
MEIFRGDSALSFEHSHWESSCAKIPDELETSSEGSYQEDDNMILATAESNQQYENDYVLNSFDNLNNVPKQVEIEGIVLYLVNKLL